MKKGGGCTNACICMETHSQPLLQNRLMDVYRLGRDEVLMAWHMHRDVVLPYLSRGGSRARQNRSRGGPLQKVSSSDRKATATN